MVGDKARRRLGQAVLATAAVGLAAVGAGSIGVDAAAAATCTPNVDNSGLSAEVVASSGETIANQTIDATGCDIGIYVGKGVTDVTIRAVTVENANYQGIFAQDTSHVTIEHSTVTGNAFNTLTSSTLGIALPGTNPTEYSLVSQSFAISLFGVSDSTVVDNTVYNNGRGGIGIMDNGPNDPGTITQPTTQTPVTPSSYDTVIGNHEWANYTGCGIVAATQNVGGSLSHLRIVGNTITGTQLSFADIGAHGADIGGIVVAADPPNSSVTDVAVISNHVTDSFEGGVTVNAEAPDSSTQNVYVIGNAVSGNNWGDPEAPDTAGIVVYANPHGAVPGNTPPENIDTVVAGNRASDQFYGIWSTGPNPPLVFGNHIEVTAGGTPIAI